MKVVAAPDSSKTEIAAKEDVKEDSWEKEPEEQKIMYLTFDDGPSAENTDKVLDVLKERNVKATFFVIGEYVRKHPETAKRIVAEGHTIGIHCDVHDYGSLYASVEGYIADFEKAYNTVYEVTGVETRLFRFPGGSVNAYNKAIRRDIIEEMEKRGFVYFDWNASLEDAAGDAKTPEELIQNAKDTTLGRKRVVMLAHDRVENTALALDALIDAFPEYKMEPLTEDVIPIQF
ncbi:MAG: polysaccharide deacetylase family protein [Suilimivivens sp.]